MAMRMVTVKLAPEKASLQHVREQLDLTPDQVDENFGVVSVSPQEDLYAVLVDEEAADVLDGSAAVEGVHSNPRIETFE
jgi:hypothetical protein